ncbi:hypothetical protein [Burkholderia vietnamiensis]|nr:hypothetical protein [Burkholderia vietnamiensis]
MATAAARRPADSYMPNKMTELVYAPLLTDILAVSKATEDGDNV